MSKHRATMGGLPTIPQVFAAYGMAMSLIGSAPPEMQAPLLAEFTGQMVSTAMQMQAPYAPRPVV